MLAKHHKATFYPAHVQTPTPPVYMEGATLLKYLDMGDLERNHEGMAGRSRDYICAFRELGLQRSCYDECDPGTEMFHEGGSFSGKEAAFACIPYRPPPETCSPAFRMTRYRSERISIECRHDDWTLLAIMN
jgi:hypothetical protein